MFAVSKEFLNKDNTNIKCMCALRDYRYVPVGGD